MSTCSNTTHMDAKSGTGVWAAGYARERQPAKGAASHACGLRRHSAGVEPMRAWWLTAAAVATLVSVLTAAQAQQGQIPESDTSQFLSPEPMQPRSVPTQTFRRPAEQAPTAGQAP